MIRDENIYVTNLRSLVELPLRRSVYLSVQCSTIASQFTQSEAKGRTLVLHNIYSTFLAIYSTSVSSVVHAYPYSQFTINHSPLTTDHSHL